MRKIFPALFALLFLAPALSLTAEEFDLGKKGRLTITVPTGWAAKSQDLPGVGVNITVRPESPLNMACKLTVLSLPEGDELTADQMIERWKGTLGRFAEGAVEKDLEVQKLNLKAGTGVYASFTDASLVGKPSEPGNYKVMAPGMIYLSKGLGVATSIFADDKTGSDFSALVKMLESITVKGAVEKTI